MNRVNIGISGRGYCAARKTGFGPEFATGRRDFQVREVKSLYDGVEMLSFRAGPTYAGLATEKIFSIGGPWRQ